VVIVRRNAGGWPCSLSRKGKRLFLFGCDGFSGRCLPDYSEESRGPLSGEVNHGSMYLVVPRAYARRRLMHLGSWFNAKRRRVTARERQPSPSRRDYLEAALTGTLSTPYGRGRVKELEQAFRNGEVSYEDACLEVEALHGAP
jgi:hypothetical protein